MNTEPLQLVVASDPERLPEIADFAEHAAKLAGLKESRMDTLAMIVTEAANNSIHHGNNNDPELPVDIKIEFLPKQLRITIKDAGKGFDPEEIPDPTTPENLLRDCGRGFLILRHFCREVLTETTSDGFTTTLLFDAEA